MGKQAQPLPDGVDGKGLSAMLVRVDITVGAGQVAPGQNMKKKIG
jgi:hypothetical protein